MIIFFLVVLHVSIISVLNFLDMLKKAVIVVVGILLITSYSCKKKTCPTYAVHEVADKVKS